MDCSCACRPYRRRHCGGSFRWERPCCHHHHEYDDEEEEDSTKPRGAPRGSTIIYPPPPPSGFHSRPKFQAVSYYSERGPTARFVNSRSSGGCCLLLLLLLLLCRLGGSVRSFVRSFSRYIETYLCLFRCPCHSNHPNKQTNLDGCIVRQVEPNEKKKDVYGRSSF